MMDIIFVEPDETDQTVQMRRLLMWLIVIKLKQINILLFEVNQLLILFYSSSFFGKNLSISDDTFSLISSTIFAYSNFGFPKT
ncbi:hypothetical protein EQN99_25435 [Escherichia coli]|nr:hypothetical protein [Escherichia coli]